MSDHHTLPAFDPHDPAGIDDLLTDDEQAVRASVRRLCEDIEPHVGAWYEAGRVDDPRALMKQLGDHGLLGMHLDGYGCPGMSAVDYGLARGIFECARPHAVRDGHGLCFLARRRKGHPHGKSQKNEWCEAKHFSDHVR